jgi:pyruvate ferredoxin oxidoreductase alpha subunit
MSGPLADPENIPSPGYMGFRRRLQETLETAIQVIAKEGHSFGKMTGRSYEDPLYRYQADDADFLFVTMGSLASEASETVDMLRDRGIKAGVIGVRVFRPFPAEAISNAVGKCAAAAVMEKAISYGYEGALATELKAALFSRNGHGPVLFNYIVGIGGKEIKPSDLMEPALETMESAAQGRRQERPRWLGYEV